MRRLYVVLLLTGMALLSGVASGFAVFYFLVYTLIGVLLVGFLWSATNLVGVHLSAKRASGLAKVGESLEAELFIQNRSPLPKVVLEVRDLADLPGQVTGTVLNLRPFQTVRWLAKAPLKKRGVYKLGPARAYSSDPFGLFRLSRAFPGVDEVTVYPATVDLQDFQLSLSDMFHHGVRYQQSHESAPSVSNIREYNPGDGFQRIHWVSTARLGRLMVKQFESEMRNHVWVVLDMHQDVQTGGEIDNTEECGVTIAASLAEKFLSMDWPVGIMAHGDHRYLLTPQLSPVFHEELLRVLAVARATGSKPLAEVLRQEWDSFSPSSRVVVITPSTDSSWLQELSGLTAYRSRLAVVLIDAHSFGGRRSSQEAQSILQQDGIITYVVRQGEPLSAALDYRQTVAYRPVLAPFSGGH
ncbi:MAG: DUF58 domain-containing protein [Chloroflexota bacterium]